MKATTPTMGMNRTGARTSPILTRELIANTELTPPSGEGGAQGISNVRIMYAQQGEKMGSIPPPASLKQAASTLAKAVAGRNMSVFVDKLGERNAFERQGVRLYDGVISKHAAYGTWTGGPSLAELQHIRDEELQHFELCSEAIVSLGGDPTVVTPSANIHGVASMGLVQVITDPRTTLLHALEMVHIAELADNDCWETLAAIARAMGQDGLAEQFNEALKHEAEHLQMVRSWIAAALSSDAGSAVPPPTAH